ncbi:phosphoadenylyl-sulfate reductase [Sediminitomix flava]|uniref:Adenosine 5'-phosphosulfate reductase n=1 Tax=Sediminitomix flava TaxID=379075 RepID=A0A315ZHA6_SEDFL|nr:phosphoadenylyl-sulfate reductase [Sediminitomix flava]PWJ44530.1 phosphoadenylylsulfate reductase (thioredoxin) [Sediminitomix flava]
MTYKTDKDTLQVLKDSLKGLSPVEALAELAKLFPGKVVFSTSLGQEDQVITDMIFKNDIPVSIFTLDTGRLFQETYNLLDSVKRIYKKPIKVYFPKTESIQKLVEEKGPNSFYQSVENRKECCFIRKVEPLQRALKGNAIWVTGLRAGQSDARQDLDSLEWDEANQIIKFHPLIDWSFDEMINYLEEHQVPYNSLHDKGFPSIGCAPCTRAVREGEDIRAGRWWWETSKKECGLHLKPTK